MDNFDNFISDEMLAAYIDGNAIPIEKNIIENYLDNGELQELMEIVSDIKNNPELIDLGESLQAEIPDKVYDEADMLHELKKNIENNETHIL